jgi:hypothetical protein
MSDTDINPIALEAINEYTTQLPDHSAFRDALVARSYPSPVTLLLTGLPLSALSAPLLVALFYFSSPHTRKSPMFIMVVLSIISSLFLAAVSAYISVR